MSLRILTTTACLTLLVSPAIVRAENLTDLNQLLSTQNCQHCNLINAGLVRANLAGAQLQGANLRNANLSQANLSQANLSGADLSGASLYGANLAGANLTGAILEQTDLRNAYLNQAQLKHTTLETAYIRGAMGIPTSASSAGQFYQIAAAEAEAGNYEAALEYFNLAISADPQYAPAYLGRGITHFRLGNQVGATQDTETALELFTKQDNARGIQTTQQFMTAMELANQPQEPNGSSSSLNRLFTTLGSLLMRFVF